MLAVQTVLFSAIVVIIISYLMFIKGYKKEGIYIGRCTLCVVLFYTILCLSLCLGE